MKNNNYLITGGAGFIGSNFIKTLIGSINYDYGKVIVIDSLTYASNYSQIENYLDKDIIFYKGDICDEDVISKIFEEHDINYVINFAAESHVDNSIKNQKKFLQTNVFGVQVLMNACMKSWKLSDESVNIEYLENRKFIQISTDEVYGSSNIDDDIYFDEKSRLNPRNPYSATKASAEHMINSFINTYNFPAIIVRSTNNYGLGQNSEKLIPKVISNIKSGKDIAVYGDGKQMRNWLHVDENCQAILEVTNKSINGEIYNIVGNNFTSNNELIKLLIEIYNENYKDDYKASIIYVKDRLGHDICYKVSGEKLKNDFGIFAKANLKEELKKIITYEDC